MISLSDPTGGLTQPAPVVRLTVGRELLDPGQVCLERNTVVLLWSTSRGRYEFRAAENNRRRVNLLVLAERMDSAGPCPLVFRLLLHLDAPPAIRR